jgi:hypothetical protein
MSMVFPESDAWALGQIVPTAAATYVVARRAHPGGRQGLYRVVGRRLVYVRSLDDPGTLTGVTPLTTR